MERLFLARFQLRFIGLGKILELRAGEAAISFDSVLKEMARGRGTPSPRSIGIIGLETKPKIIYGLQQLAGKILSGKELEGPKPLHGARSRILHRTAFPG
jgi:hypothetical protein